MVREGSNKRRVGGCLLACPVMIWPCLEEVDGVQYPNRSITSTWGGLGAALGALCALTPCTYFAQVYIEELVACLQVRTSRKTKITFPSMLLLPLYHLHVFPETSFLSVHPGGRLTPLNSGPSS